MCMYCIHSWRKGSANGIRVFMCCIHLLRKGSVNDIRAYVLYSFVNEGECAWYTCVCIIFISGGRRM